MSEPFDPPFPLVPPVRSGGRPCTEIVVVREKAAAEPTAPDPGNLPKRMAEVIASHEWDGFPQSAHSQHNYYGACAVCQRDVRRMVEVALSVRDELVAHLSARAAAAEAKVAHAEEGAQLASEGLAKVKQELAEARNLSGIREKLLREAWDAHHATMDERDALQRNLAAKEAEIDGLNRDREGWRTRANTAEAGQDALKVAAQAALDKPYAARTIRMLCAALAAAEPAETTTTPARETV